MPIRTELWRIDNGLEKVSFSALEAEKKLQSILEKDISIVDPGLMVIGRQVLTSFGKYIDLLGIDSEGHLAILELKRDRTPRDVVAQTLDYASWVQELTYDDIIKVYATYDTTQDFESAFEETFGSAPPETLNEDHKILIVSAELDNHTERIVNYLSSNYGVPINAVFFQYFKEEKGEYLSRSWLIDPVKVETQASKVVKSPGKEQWNGVDYYVSFGEGTRRNWEDAVKYGFIAAGGGKWYSNTLSLLPVGARIFVYVPQAGYVGVGIVKEEVKPVKHFSINIDGASTPILRLPLNAGEMVLEELSSIAFLYVRRAIDTKLTYVLFAYWIDRYWIAAEEYILAVRKTDHMSYVTLEAVAKNFIAKERKDGYRFSPDDIESFLREEKRHKRRRARK
jgi:hypothetical protein